MLIEYIFSEKVVLINIQLYSPNQIQLIKSKVLSEQINFLYVYKINTLNNKCIIIA